MEKLKAKHDHSLTDILKVLIFSLFLLIPGIMFLPSMLYFGFNHEANAPVKEVQVQENKVVDFNEGIKNVDFTTNDVWYQYNTTNTTLTYDNNSAIITLNNDNQSRYTYGLCQINVPSVLNHQYLVKMYYKHTYNGRMSIEFNNVGMITDVTNDTNTLYQNIFTLTSLRQDKRFMVYPYANYVQGDELTFYYVNIYDLTLMFGEGNEPTIEQFNTYFPNSYYPYTESEEIILTVDGPTEQVVDITTQLEWNWEQIWQRPILSWTKYSILKQGLDAFTNVFGVLQTSYITNLIAYELIMVAIYIVIDIVISVFKWITHIIGTK